MTKIMIKKERKGTVIEIEIGKETENVTGTEVKIGRGKEIGVKKKTPNEVGMMREVEIAVEVGTVIEDGKIGTKEGKPEIENWMKMSCMKNGKEKGS